MIRSAESATLSNRTATPRAQVFGLRTLIHQAASTASTPDSPIVSTMLPDIRAKLSAGVVSRMLAIIARSIMIPKLQIKYCAEALSRINRLITTRSSLRKEARVVRIFITLKATSGMLRNTSQLCRLLTGSRVKTWR